jgi:hypothetical protein
MQQRNVRVIHGAKPANSSRFRESVINVDSDMCSIKSCVHIAGLSQLARAAVKSCGSQVQTYITQLIHRSTQ